ncbi:MAG: filamentous hemagglutinin N-terminal domain-containing protein [Cyanobacteria bacterium RU_5_0]|nr:filamentous hemagglutinin N-terminal domain-containing protein [Cyanobacteria bacterium RU_5_0]
MNRCHLQQWFAISSILGLLLGCHAAIAQVVSDDTLPEAERSRVSGDPDFQIDGGARQGNNLFHSFSEFSVPTGGSASFNNATDIETIFSRVTGGSISNIDGLIRANGAANLFLLNPNGIIFGANARLDIGGSFVASTADRILFTDGIEFSATNPQASLLLTVSVPIGLQYGSDPGDIRLDQTTLEVNQGRTLALLGGTIQINDGLLLAPGGHIELGGLADTATVGLSIDSTGNLFNFRFPGNVQRTDVFLTNSTDVDVRAAGGGSIAINARNINMFEGSLLRAGIRQNLGSVDVAVGDVIVNATGTVTLRDTSLIVNFIAAGATGDAGDILIEAGSLRLINGSQLFAGTEGNGNAGRVTIVARDRVSFEGIGTTGVASGAFSSVAPGATGNGRNITVRTGSFVVTGGAGLYASTFEAGNAGSITIIARDRVSFDGFNRVGGASGAFSSVAPSGVGNGGNITIETRELSLTNGGGLYARTEGNGNAGNITVNAALITLSGVSSFFFSSGLFTDTRVNAEGQGGNITINTDSLNVRDGAVLSAQTSTNERGGTITVNANTLELANGGQLLTTASDSGEAGNIIVNVTDGITIFGSDSTFADRLAEFREQTDPIYFVSPVSSFSGLFANTELNSTGQGGSIQITTGQLTLQDGGTITVNSRGTGDAGSIQAQAESIRLDNGSTISADTFAGEGNINLTTESLVLRRASSITTNAENTAIGGNIAIDTTVLAATENSDISADSVNARGGNVTIDTDGLFGIEFRPQITPFNDITATGADSGLSGNVQINVAEINPTQGLVELPTEVTDTSRLIAQGCPANQGSSFVVTGRGGLPPLQNKH